MDPAPHQPTPKPRSAAQALLELSDMEAVLERACLRRAVLGLVALIQEEETSGASPEPGVRPSDPSTPPARLRLLTR